MRDSSDDHYIFSLTFKLNGSVRHVRIDQDQGKFKAMFNYSCVSCYFRKSFDPFEMTVIWIEDIFF